MLQASRMVIYSLGIMLNYFPKFSFLFAPRNNLSISHRIGGKDRVHPTFPKPHFCGIPLSCCSLLLASLKCPSMMILCQNIRFSAQVLQGEMKNVFILLYKYTRRGTPFLRQKKKPSLALTNDVLIVTENLSLQNHSY